MTVYFKNVNNNKTYQIDEGAVITETKNETLDSATIKISNVPVADRLISVSAFDTAVIYDAILGYRYFVVDTIRETMINLSPKIYNYEISLFSETKLLENILLPNLKITRIKENPRTIKYYLEQYLNEYGPKYRDKTLETWEYSYFWGYGVLDYFDDTECPEMQWNQPTLREVLNDLMMVKDCIVVLNNGAIGYLNLTDKNPDPIDANTDINYIQSSKSSEDYVSELKMNLVNVMQSDDDVKNYVNKAEWIYFQPENGNFIKSDNLILKTQYPILNIKHLYMFIYGLPVVESGATYAALLPENGYPNVGGVFDLCNAQTIYDKNNDLGPFRMVLEKREYDTQDIAYNINDIGSYIINDVYGVYYPFSLLSKYQNALLYYSRGDNVIHGFDEITKTGLWSLFTTTTIQQIVNSFINGSISASDLASIPWNLEGIWTTLTSPHSADATAYYRVAFKIEYETTANSVFTASKQDYPLHKKIVMDNQTNSYVDCNKQGFLEYMKANRLGNKQLLINARHETSSENNIIQISDVYDDSIVYQVQYQIYKNFININAYATKDYILRNYFAGVKAKIRSWKIVDGSEALTRHELIKYYFEFSFNKYEEYQLNVVDLSHYMLSPLYDDTDPAPITYCGLKTYYVADGTYPNAQYPTSSADCYLMDISSRLIGNSIVFTINTVDNFEIARYVDSDNITFLTNISLFEPDVNGLTGIPMKPYRYVNEQGEINQQTLYLSSQLNLVVDLPNTNDYITDIKNIKTPWLLPVDAQIDAGDDEYVQRGANAFMKTIYAMPKVPISAMPLREFQLNIYKHKDNSEILADSVQFELCTDTRDIVFTKEFIKMEKAIRTVSYQVGATRIFVGDADDFDPDNIQQSFASAVENYGAITTVTNNKVEISLTADSTKAYYIADNSANPTLLLAMKGHTTCYLNMLLDRDKNTYSDDGFITGNIKVDI